MLKVRKCDMQSESGNTIVPTLQAKFSVNLRTAKAWKEMWWGSGLSRIKGGI